MSGWNNWFTEPSIILVTNTQQTSRCRAGSGAVALPSKYVNAMVGVLGHDSGLVRLYGAGVNLG